MSFLGSSLPRSCSSSRGIRALWEMELWIRGCHFFESWTTPRHHTQDWRCVTKFSRTSDVWIFGGANFLGTSYVFSKYFKPSAILIWLKFSPETPFSKKMHYLFLEFDEVFPASQPQSLYNKGIWFRDLLGVWGHLTSHKWKSEGKGFLTLG